MVDKTKRAITILQQRGVDTPQPFPNDTAAAAVSEIRRQTEEKVAEFKRNAEDAVNQVGQNGTIFNLHILKLKLCLNKHNQDNFKLPF